jgi:biotin carboxyl carrier protein
VTLDIVRTGNTWSILRGTRSYEVTVVEEAPGALAVSVDGRVVRIAAPVRRAGSAELGGLARRTRREKPGAGGTEGPQSITAPMPGRIVKVLVKPGDPVAARQGLVVVEAMKMENELRSPSTGTVTEVRVTQGQLVDARAVLVIVE